MLPPYWNTRYAIDTIQAWAYEWTHPGAPAAIPRAGSPASPLRREIGETLGRWPVEWTSDGVRDIAI